MSNGKNLIPNSKRSPEEVRENSRKGGVKSGETRRRKRSMKTAAKLMLNMGVQDFEEYQKLANLGLPNDEITNIMSVIAAMIKQAQKGSVQAAVFLRDTIGESPMAEINRENIRERRKEKKEDNEQETEPVRVIIDV